MQTTFIMGWHFLSQTCIIVYIIILMDKKIIFNSGSMQYAVIFCCFSSFRTVKLMSTFISFQHLVHK